MRVTADGDVCVGAGQCVMAAEAVFDQDDNGIVTVLVERPGEAHAEAVHDAEMMCPAGAITVED